MKFYSKPETVSFSAYVQQLTQNGARLCVAGSTDLPFWTSRHSSNGTTFVEPPQVGKWQTVILSMYQAGFHKTQLASAIDYERKYRREYASPLTVPTVNPTIQTKEADVAYEQKDLTGALFRIPEDKRKSESWPTHEGSVIVEGRKYYLSAWVKEAKSGQKYFSLALKPADEKPAANGKPQTKGAPAVDDAIPFDPERR
jgi:hypothetical protein